MENIPINTETVNRKPIKRLGIWLMIPLVGGIIALCILSVEWKSTLKIDHIVVEGTRILTASQIYALANVQLKSSMQGIDLFDVRQHILGQAFVKSVSVNREFPDHLRIRIIEREPIATINDGQLWYIDAERVLLPYVQSSMKLDVPVISGIDGVQKMQIGQTISNAELSQAIVLLQTAQAIDTTIYHFISEINMNGGKDIILYSSDDGVPIIVGRGNVEKKLVTLQSFWNNFGKSQSTEKLRYVDLRFDDQVVVKWQNDAQQSRTKASL
ncbi:MAG: FtsQ-type POTRA domain-containing protein [Ignavibacteria bacterium]|nr:FtsQ-type POTRA domain-containing protein [Ignavibacteria bacterium]